MSRKIYLYVVLAFGLGVAVGAAGLFLFAWYGGHWRQHFGRRHLVAELTRQLKLSGAQVEQLNRILDDTSKKFAALRRQVQPQFDALRRQSQDEVRAILTPEQAKKYDEMVRQWEQKMRQHGPPP